VFHFATFLAIPLRSPTLPRLRTLQPASSTSLVAISFWARRPTFEPGQSSCNVVRQGPGIAIDEFTVTIFSQAIGPQAYAAVILSASTGQTVLIRDAEVRTVIAFIDWAWSFHVSGDRTYSAEGFLRGQPDNPIGLARWSVQISLKGDA